MKKWIPIVLSITMSISVLGTACKKEEDALSVNGVKLERYTIVYDADDLLSRYCAFNIADALSASTGLKLPVVADTQENKKQAREILVGKTNREESVTLQNITLDKEEYIFTVANGKILLYADGYMVGGAANHFVNGLVVPAYASDELKIKYESTSTPYTYTFQAPENVILMIGDGMGNNHIDWAKTEGVISEFYAESMPNKATVRTYSYSVYLGQEGYTDSAAAATALATGYKTTNGCVGITPEGKSVQNVRELANIQGAKTAVLTTDSITGATPAGFTAHVNSRGSEAAIQNQIDALLESGDLTVAEGKIGFNDCTEVARRAMNTISKDNSTFFAMIEEGWIDKNSHSNSKLTTLDAMQRFNDVIAYIMQFVLMHPNTVLLVTADHETGGVTKQGAEYVFTSVNHTNADVSLFSMGATTERLTGTMDNIDIAKYIAEIYGSSDFGGDSLM